MTHRQSPLTVASTEKRAIAHRERLWQTLIRLQRWFISWALRIKLLLAQTALRLITQWQAWKMKTLKKQQLQSRAQSHPPTSNTPCIINNRSISLTFIDLQLCSSRRLFPLESLRVLGLQPPVGDLNHKKGSAAYPNSCASLRHAWCERNGESARISR